MKISTAHMAFQPCLAVSLLFFSMQLHAQTFNTVEQCEVALKQQNDRYKEVHDRTVKCQREIDPLNSACLTLSKESDWNLKRASEIRSQCYALRDALRKANSSSSSSASNSRHSSTNTSNSRTDSSYSAAEAERQRAALYWEQRAAQERQQQLEEQRKAEHRSQKADALGTAAISIFNAREERREAELARKEVEADRRQAAAENAFASLGTEMQGVNARGDVNPYVGRPCKYFTGASKSHKSGASIAYEGNVYKCAKSAWVLVGPAWSVDTSTYKEAEEVEK